MYIQRSIEVRKDKLLHTPTSFLYKLTTQKTAPRNIQPTPRDRNNPAGQAEMTWTQRGPNQKVQTRHTIAYTCPKGRVTPIKHVYEERVEGIQQTAKNALFGHTPPTVDRNRLPRNTRGSLKMCCP